MNKPIIEIENLGKCYRIGAPREPYLSLRDEVARFAIRLRSRDNSLFEQDFWALKGVTITIQEGEAVGVIGRNGAGKSTLLKILSQITPPTEGHITMRGRVASLLEVGTGFHPELSGRENIFLNGAILGMSRAEIRRKFDEIVAFAEIDEFLDTPVKRYSSGMYVRLAFAVAAHLEPEILVIDEVLAVGDAQFQKKCLGKMNDVAKQGRTVLFVTHNMSALQAFCGRCLVLNKGEVIADADVDVAIKTYLRDASAADSFKRATIPGKMAMIISGNITINPSNTLLRVDTEIFSDKVRSASLDLRVSEITGAAVAFGSLGALDATKLVHLKAGITTVSFTAPIGMLAIGGYYLSLDITQPDLEYFDRLENCFTFEVVRPPQGTARRVLSQDWRYGSIELPLSKV